MSIHDPFRLLNPHPSRERWDFPHKKTSLAIFRGTWWWTTHESFGWVSSPQLCLWTRSAPTKIPLIYHQGCNSPTWTMNVGSSPASIPHGHGFSAPTLVGLRTEEKLQSRSKRDSSRIPRLGWQSGVKLRKGPCLYLTSNDIENGIYTIYSNWQ